MKIYLIRHGQTTGDIENRYGGDYDDELTSEGQNQSKELTSKLTGADIEVIYTSPRIRAQQLSQILSSSLSCKTETINDLRERNQYGVLTGMIKEEAKKKHPKLVEEVKDYKNQIEGAETYTDFVERVKRVFSEITSSSQATVGIVTHGGVIRTIFREILNYGEIDIADCGYAVIELNDGDYKIDKLDGVETRTD